MAKLCVSMFHRVISKKDSWYIFAAIQHLETATRFCSQIFVQFIKGRIICVAVHWILKECMTVPTKLTHVAYNASAVLVVCPLVAMRLYQ